MRAHKILWTLGTAVLLSGSGIGLPVLPAYAQNAPPTGPHTLTLINGGAPPVHCNSVGVSTVSPNCGGGGTGPVLPPGGTPAPPGTVTLPPGGTPPPGGGPVPIGTGPGSPGTPAPPSTSPYAPTLPPLSSAQVASEIASASSVGGGLLLHRPTAYMDAGGEKGLGTVKIANDTTATNVNRLVPNTADTSYLTRLHNADDGQDLLGYKAMYDQVKTEDYGHQSAYTQARVSAHNSAAFKAYSPSTIISDPAMQSSAADINASKNGTILGQVFGACSTSTTTGPPTTVNENNEETCTKVQIPGSGGPACTRNREATATQTYLNGAETGSLNVDPGYNHMECTRSTGVTYVPNTPAQSQSANLPITTETGGLSCTRQMTASVTAVNSNGSAAGDLSINTEMGGHACTRNVTVSGGAQDLGPVTIGADAPITVTCIAPYTFTFMTPAGVPTGAPAGTTSITNLHITKVFHDTQYPSCGTIPNVASGPITAAGGWKTTTTYNPALPLPPLVPGQIDYGYFAWGVTITGEAFGAGSAPTVAVSDTGNCGATGDATCPTKWTCTTNAPTTIAGVSITTAEAAKVAPIFPGAASTCVVASLDGVCSGSATTTSNISIATDLPPGVTMTTPADSHSPNAILRGMLPAAYAGTVPPPAFSNFTWTVTNPQPGVTVTLVAPPSASNGWVAQFQVTRTNFTYVPVQPHITMSWTVSTSTLSFGKGDTGNCSDPGSTACPTQWTCTQNAPTTIDGYPVTAADAATIAPLFPGAASSCTTAQLDRVCDGSSSLSDTVGIGGQLPAGTQTISNFAWTVTNPNPAITVVLVSAPTLANGWTATFKVTRQYSTGGTTPPDPNVYLTWTANGPPTPVIGSTDNGNCSPPAPGGACTNAWHCTEQPPATINGTVVTTPVPDPLYPGANPSTCLAGELDETCSGTGATTTPISIASKIYTGDTAITNFAWSVTTAVPGVTVTLEQTPSLANNWVAIFQTTRTDWTSAPAGKPAVTMTWTMKGPVTYTFNIVDTGNCSTTSNAYCTVSWACNQSAPVTVNGLVIPASVVQQQPALFTGDGGACMKATLSYNCSGVWDPGSHQVCWINEQGVQQCYTVPPSSTPPDTCGPYETNTQCHLEQSGCVAGAEDSSGWCYVMSYEYVCVTPVQVPGSSTTSTTCTGTQPCLNGTCAPTTAPTTSTSDIGKSTARRVFENTIETDWTYTGPTTTPPNPNAPPPPPGGGTPTPPGGGTPTPPGGGGGQAPTPPCPTGEVMKGISCEIP